MVKIKDEAQDYINEIVEKYNKNRNDDTLSPLERVLLNKLIEALKGAQDAQDTINALTQETLKKQGEAQGIIDALVALKKDEEWKSGKLIKAGESIEVKYD